MNLFEIIDELQEIVQKLRVASTQSTIQNPRTSPTKVEKSGLTTQLKIYQEAKTSEFSFISNLNKPKPIQSNKDIDKENEDPNTPNKPRPR